MTRATKTPKAWDTITAREYQRELKKRPSFKERHLECILTSKLSVDIQLGVGLSPLSVIMRFSGSLAKIPSLKNSKVPGLNCPNADVTARISAMDSLWWQQVDGRQLSFGRWPIFVVLICGHRNRQFDVDNCFSTVRDWLEPATKPVGRVDARGKRGARGWGIGLTDNDSLITGVAVSAETLGLCTEDSIIVVRSLGEVVSGLRHYLERFMPAWLLDERREAEGKVNGVGG